MLPELTLMHIYVFTMQMYVFIICMYVLNYSTSHSSTHRTKSNQYLYLERILFSKREQETVLRYFGKYMETFSAPSKDEIERMLKAEQETFIDKTYKQVRNHINNKNKNNKKYGLTKFSKQLSLL